MGTSEDPRADREDPRLGAFDPLGGGGEDPEDVDVEENLDEAREETSEEE